MIYSSIANHAKFKYAVSYNVGYINTNNKQYAYKLAFLLSTTVYVRDYDKNKWKFFKLKDGDIEVGYV